MQHVKPLHPRISRQPEVWQVGARALAAHRILQTAQKWMPDPACQLLRAADSGPLDLHHSVPLHPIWVRS